jgi:hypothetical protein
MTYEISWRFKEGYRSGWALLCFWKEGDSFGHDPYSEHENGLALAFNDYQDGHIFKRLETGKTYSFTAFLKQLHARGEEKLAKLDYVQFHLRIPSADEMESLERFIESVGKLKTPPEPKEETPKRKPIDEELDQMLQGIDDRIKRSAALHDCRATLIDAVKKKNYPPNRNERKLR